MTNTEIHTASNSDVVKLKGRARVMRQAWFQFRLMAKPCFSKALKNAWACLRASVTLDLKGAMVLAQMKAEREARDAKAKISIKARKAAWSGPKDSRSPLNPFNAVDPMGGKWGQVYCETVAGR